MRNGTTGDEPSSFREFEAASLFCPNCRAAVPVRKRLLLTLPDGATYDYHCSYCNTIVGAKKDSTGNNSRLFRK